MSSVAPIGSMRTVGIQPAMPMPGADPYEDGLDVDVVREAAVVREFNPSLVGAVEPTHDVAADPEHRRAPASVWTPAPLAAIDSHRDAAPRAGQARGNATIATGFDAEPAVDLQDAQRAAHAESLVAGAYAAWSQR